MLAHIFPLIFGLVILVGGGELLIKGSVQLAKALKLAPAVIGLTVVSFGTSAPELMVSLDAAMSGSPDIAIGNVIGSNICNILLITGVSALLITLTCNRQLALRDGGIMIGVCVLFIALCLDGVLSQMDGALLFAGAIIYNIYVYKTGKIHITSETPTEAEIEQAAEKASLWCPLGYTVVGLALLATGADLLVDSAVGLATVLGISEAIIGLTIVAIGTSLPELAASVIAAYRKHEDVGVANIIGSTIFNILVILGLTASVQPIPVAEEFLAFDIWFMLAVVVGTIVALLTGGKISRKEGAVFLAIFFGYLIYQYMQI